MNNVKSFFRIFPGCFALGLSVAFALDSSAHANDLLDCAQIWKKGFPLAGYESSFPCYFYGEYPYGRGVARLYFAKSLASTHPMFPEGTPVPTAEAVLQDIKQSVADSQHIYQQWMNPRSVAVVLTGLPNDGAAITPQLHHQDDEPVPITIFSGFFLSGSNVRKQSFAHELFHAYQADEMGEASNPLPARWWVEGSADFFSNVVYPSTNNEWDDEEAYDQDTQLFAQPLEYSTAAFFQSLSNQFFGPKAVIDLLEQMPKGPTIDQATQWQALTDAPTMNIYFHNFAKEFAQHNIKDSGGAIVPTHFIPPAPTPVSSPTFIDSIRPKPFTIVDRRYALTGGKKWTIRTIGQTNHLSASVRREGAEHFWNQAFDGYPLTLDLTCKTHSPKPDIYSYLVTSTVGPGDHPPALQVQIDSETVPCSCQESGPPAKELVGHWRLRLDSVKEFLARSVRPGASKLSVDSVTGEYLLTLNSDHTIVSQMNNVVIDAHQEGGIQIHAEMDGIATTALYQTELTRHICVTDASMDLKSTLTITMPGMAPVTSETPLGAAWPEGVSSLLSLEGPELTVLKVDKEVSDGGPPVKMIYDRLDPPVTPPDRPTPDPVPEPHPPHPGPMFKKIQIKDLRKK
ncbi:MAG: hypothetical protein ACXVCE_03110 [Bacteriovorax sp.]